MQELQRDPEDSAQSLVAVWQSSQSLEKAPTPISIDLARVPSHLLIQMLAPAYQLSARDQIAPAYQLSALDHSQVIGDQTFYFPSLSERLSETLFIGQPLQRLSSAASERPQKNRRTFFDDNFHSCLRPGPGQRPTLAVTKNGGGSPALEPRE